MMSGSSSTSSSTTLPNILHRDSRMLIMVFFFNCWLYSMFHWQDTSIESSSNERLTPECITNYFCYIPRCNTEANTRKWNSYSVFFPKARSRTSSSVPGSGTFVTPRISIRNYLSGTGSGLPDPANLDPTFLILTLT